MTLNQRVYLVLDGRHFGGIEAHVCALCRKLSEHHIAATITLWHRYTDGNLPERLAALQLPVHYLSGSNLSKLQQLRTLARQGVLHSHGYKAGLLCRIATLSLGRRSVHTLHSGDCGDGAVKYYLNADLNSCGLSHTMAVSDAIAARVNRPLPVIRNFLTPPPLPQRKSSSTLRIGFIGRYCHDKGYDRFIRLALQDPQHHWVSFGQGELAETNQGAVEDRGFCRDVNDALAQLDLLVIPSRCEGLPLVALEALAAQVAVIAFAVGDLPKLIDSQVGALVKANDMTAIGDAITEFARLTPTQRQQLGQQGRARVQQHWHGDDTVLQCLIYYRAAGMMH
ncbi:glycosyltransferase [Ferrimonas senticii]|uniref:glycosyltransferase n=1 Tax=Ferrimonas senticii TaxID=394566 RepID=UPI000401637A|nr:glycosyltransferase [Ferrimonas senticii]